MRLSRDDANLFFKLHPSYLFYVNTRLNVLENIKTVDDFMALSFHDKSTVRNAARNHPEMPAEFVRENPFAMNDVELAIINSWQYALDGSFYVMRYDSDHAVFLDTGTAPRAYGVTCLNKDLRDILGPDLPVYVKTVLLPFKNNIVYDGFIFTYPVTFDPPVIQELEADLNAWIRRHGVVTELPFIGEDTVENNEDRLRYFLRSPRNRDVYAEEIAALLEKAPALEKLYYELAGRLDARDARRFFRSVGIRDVWCAVLNGRILATGTKRDTVTEILGSILPKDRKLYPYIFHFKG